MTLNAAGSILDAFNTDFTKIKAKQVILTATGGTIGSGSNYLDIDAKQFVTADARNSIWLSQFEGDLRVNHILSQLGDVDLRAEFSIVDAATKAWDNSGAASLPAPDVFGNSISLTAQLGGIGDAINALDIDSQYSAPGGVLTASSDLLNIYIIETKADVLLNTVSTGAGLSAFITAPTGSIFNGIGPGKPNVLSGNTKLFASKNIGANGFAIVTKVGHIEAESTTGSTFIDNQGELAIGGDFTGDPNGVVTGGTATITAASPITLTKSIIAGGDVVIVATDDAKDGKDPANDDIPDDLTVLAKDLFGKPLFIKAASSINLFAGDDMLIEQGALLQGGVSINLYGDQGVGRGRDKPEEPNADPGIGSTIIVAGTLTSPTITIHGNIDPDRILITTGELTAKYPWATPAEFYSIFGEKAQYPREPTNVSQIAIFGDADPDVISVWGDVTARDIFIFGNAGEDEIALNPENKDGYKLQISGHIRIFGGSEVDDITVNKLNTLDYADKYLQGVIGPGRLVTGLTPDQRDTVDIDGEGQADHVTINMTRKTDYIVNIHDSGSPAIDSDVVVINGTEEDDTFLLRDNFVVLLQPTATGFAQAYERVNYDDTINVLQINAYKGDDAFYVDGNSAITQLDGGVGKDSFQFGQVYGAARSALRVAVDDMFATYATTLGYLSKGISFATVAYGDDGDDSFVVYANRAPLELWGGSGDDSFIVRAFVNVKPSDIASINGPVNIDGGVGIDRVSVIGGELGDSFVVTRNAVVGAGMNVTYGRAESLEVDAMEGDDHFYVLSTAAGVATALVGGLGSDTFDAGGDVVTPIIATSIEGQSGIINHNIISQDAAYNGIAAEGVSLNVSSRALGPVIVTETNGDTVVMENGPDPKAAGDSYTLRMGAPPKISDTTGGLTFPVVYITVSAALAAYRDASQGGRSVQVSVDNINFYDSLVVTFDYAADKGTPTVWDREQMIYVRAVGDATAEGEQTIVISHSMVSDDPAYNRANIANVLVRVIDDDSAGLFIRQTGTTTQVAEGGASDTYAVSLTKAPAPGETVTVTLVTDPSQIKLSTDVLKFTAADWNQPVTVKVSAVNDAVIENPGEFIVSHTITSSTPGSEYDAITDVSRVTVDVRDNDTGGLLVTQSNDATLVAGLLDDTYTLQLTRAPKAPVTVQILTDGKTLVSADASSQLPGRFAIINKVPTVTFDSTNWKVPFTVRVTALDNTLPLTQHVFPAQPHLTSPIQGPLTLEGGPLKTADRSLVKSVRLFTETDAKLPTLTISTKEKLQTDTVNVFNDGSVTNDKGELDFVKEVDGLAAQFGLNVADIDPKSFGNIGGLGMGVGGVLDMGKTGAPDFRTFNGGIVFHNVEIADTMLGTGKDEFTVVSTLDGMITVVQGGGGDDTLVALDGGGAGSPLILLGDTTQDGHFYDSTTALLTGHAREFAKPGNDTIDASKAGQSVMIYGGGGNDTILGSAAGDWIAGGSGNDTISSNGGDDVVSGDDGFNLDLSKRLDLSTQVLLVAIDVAAADHPATRDFLIGGADTIKGGDGIDVIIGDHGPVTQAAGTQRIFTTGQLLKISATLPNGGDDKLYGEADDDIILGGAGSDYIHGATGNNIVIGDNGQVAYATPGILSLIQTADPKLSGNDQIIAGGNDDIVLGGSGSDTIAVNQGTNIVIGDGGKITYLAGHISKIETTPLNAGGADTITAGSNDDIILGGAGHDTIDAGDGANIVFGDNGYITYTATGTPVEIKSTGPTTVGNDVITTLGGADLIIGGNGVDTIDAGDGMNIVFGDGGWLSWSAGGLSSAQTIDATAGASDKIATGTDQDIIFGGHRNDQITAGDGDNVVFGDAGILTFNGTLFASVASTDTSVGGNDTITTGIGNDLLIGGAGSDTLRADDGTNIVLGDNGMVTFNGITLSKVETIDPKIGGNDRIFTGIDNDLLLGGSGDDVINGGAGNQIILGDNGYVLFDAANLPVEIQSTDSLTGGADQITTAGGADIVIGGANGDTINAGHGDNLVFGDNAWLTYAGGVLSTARTIAPTSGGNDRITTGNGRDAIFGGFGDDTINAGPGDNAVVGDNGSLSVTAAGLWNKISTTDPRVGGNDAITTGNGADLIFGGTGADTAFAGDGNDIAFGDNGYAIYASDGVVVFATSTDFSYGTDDVIWGESGDDVLVGGTGDDALDGGIGRDLIFGDQASIDRQSTRDDKTSTRFRVLKETLLYSLSEGSAGEVLVSDDPQVDPSGIPAWNDFVITLLNMGAVDVVKLDADYIAGGADSDMIFGQQGDDVIQGDGSIDTKLTQDQRVFARRDASNTLLMNPSFDAASDGDDYIEGNSGNDTIFGNQGQDDIIGGSSSLFSLVKAADRADGADMIFGGSGLAAGRNDEGNTGEAGHAADADMILGDNGIIFRIVGVNGEASGKVTFNYDNYSEKAKIVVRGAVMLDYTPGGSDYVPDGALKDLGAADEIHGESGDDFIFGMVGADVLFGDAQNDSIVGGYGTDWISGGTGDDGILGDDGLIFASRNSTEYGEPLYGIDPVSIDEINKVITDEKALVAVINLEGALKYTADLTPDNLDPSKPQDPLFVPLDANDIIFGGLGNDSIHAGAGNDAVSGAEAQVKSYITNYTLGGTLIAGSLTESDFDKPFNPGNPLGYSPLTTKFALFDDKDPLHKIMLSKVGTLQKDGGLEWFLNFDAKEGPADQIWADDITYPRLPTDGDDRIFGDLGNDWIVGGTGRDSLWAGWGDDLINADDDHTTKDNLNIAADTNPSYEDLVYGGAGYDVLIGNTGGDRLVDWEDSFNTYLLPFVNPGLPTVTANITDGVQHFLLDLSRSQGADLSLIAQHGGDPARNGEPYGELGLVNEKDPEWPDQLGPTRDPQPPNLPPTPDVEKTAGERPIWQFQSAPTVQVADTFLTAGDLAPIVTEAKAIWTSKLGLDDPRLSILNQVTVSVGNLPESALGVTLGDTILIDGDAAGWGWFVDPTPQENSEFVVRLSDVAWGAAPNSLASGRMDLLSTVLHELGNAMGFAETDAQDVTGMFLAAGVRTLPGPATPGAADAPAIDWRARYAPEEFANRDPAWVDDFLNNLGQDKSRNPNAGIRLRAPGS
ncbi:MAG: hypothetical protein AB7F35_05720 [Acetobacteraceae bacterium]